jgi:methionyl-tRNA formyltransferase
MRILFCGTPDFAATILEGIVDGPHPVVGLVSRPPQPQGRGLAVAEPPAVLLARSRGIPVVQTPKLHAAETLARLRELRPELLITAAFGRILRPALLELAPRGAWNVHASLLPRHRGASPVAASILCGDAWTGITLFRLDTGVDTGPILVQEMTPIGVEENAGELTDRLARMGGRLLADALDLEAGGRLTPRPQPDWGATHAPLLAKEDGRIDWNRPVEQVERSVRALTPWPGAFTFAEGKRLRIHRARPVHRIDLAIEREPGSLLPSVDGIGVVCRPGLLALLDVQVEGRKRQSAPEWLRGSRIPIDSVLDGERP